MMDKHRFDNLWSEKLDVGMWEAPEIDAECSTLSTQPLNIRVYSIKIIKFHVVFKSLECQTLNYISISLIKSHSKDTLHM